MRPRICSQVERIAVYYEQRGELDKAGDMWARTEQRERALKLYLRVRDGWMRQPSERRRRVAGLQCARAKGWGRRAP